MSSNQKRGFRLPWGSERDPDEAATAAAMDELAAGDHTTGAVRDDLGEGPFGRPDGAQTTTTDAAPAAADVPTDTPEAAMIDAEEPASESAAAQPQGNREQTGTWPVVDRRAADRRGADRPFMDPEAAGEPRLPRRDNPLVAGLVKAMREAAIASRAETTARLESEATARVEAIRARATTEAGDLRKRAEDDVNGIREWSKAEIARLRQETDDKIEARRAELAAEAARHATGVDRLVEQVKTTVTAFEADMDEFFERLLAESDPARLATLAEQAPEPPDLSGDGPAPYYDVAVEGDTHSEGMSAVDVVRRLHADDAAEAEAEAGEGLDPDAAGGWPSAVPATGRGAASVPSPADANGPGSTRLLVTGLTSVAGISAFKGALGQLAGVRNVSVSSGEPGVFVFTVSHDPGVDLDSGVASLPGFTAKVTDATDDGFTVAAQETAA
jgi:hypothetical protein